ncbi:MAG: hypothetical protein Q4A06_03255 [Cardiobacteriaceae bacterium]|nr:hypothetical protein [Cardiobacteriaceae bacterium]
METLLEMNFAKGRQDKRNALSVVAVNPREGIVGGIVLPDICGQTANLHPSSPPQHCPDAFWHSHA